MYKAIFVAGYYGLLHISEIAAGPHQILAHNVHIGINKDKVLFVLLTSKTHNKGNLPQTVKITSLQQYRSIKYCPFQILRNYVSARCRIKEKWEPFFVSSDRSSISAACIRSTLRKCITKTRLNPRNYSFHSFREGRSTDMLEMGYSIDEIKKVGRWKSNAVYTYLK